MSFGRLSTCSRKEPAMYLGIYGQDMYLDKFIAVW